MNQLWPAAHNAHLASAGAEHQYNFLTYLGSTCMPIAHCVHVLSIIATKLYMPYADAK